MAQICSQSAEVPLALSEAYELGKTYGRRRLSISDSPTNLIECVLDETTGLHIIIDGLDELEDATEVFKFVRYCSHPGSRVRILILSRDLQRIRTDMSPFPTITLDVEQMKDDVRAFVSEAATRLPVQDPVFRESIISRVSQKADGKFLWSRWVMESLVNSVSLPHLMALLDEVPQGLSAVYADYLAELAKKDQHVQDLGVTLLQWVCCSKRTLSGEELQFAVAKHDEHTQGKGTPVVPFLPVLVELGHPLVIYQHDQDRFRLQHLSVREFLLDSNRRDALPPALHKFLVDEGVASRKLADKCLSCLSETPNPHTKKPPPLTPYAVRYWCEHVVQAPWASDLQAAVQQFLQDEERRRSWLADLLLQDGRGFSLQSMLRLQKQLTDWMVTNTTNTTGATNTQPNGLPSDWADDTLAILLQVDEGKFGKIEPPLSYFEKLMVIRDLARMLKQADRVQAGIARLEACLHSPKPNVGIEQVWIMNALGILYSQCEETGHSIVLHNRALIMQEATLGPSNMETMWTINELGRMHRHLGDFAGATARHQQALTVLKSILPSDHLEIVWTECTLARALRKQDKHKEALVLHQRAHDVYSRVLGHEHAHTLWTLGDIAQCLRSLGRLEESEEYHRRALKGRSKALGPEHPDTLWTINDLGVVLDERGNLEEALTLQQQALKAQERVLGSEHPHTKWTRNILDELKERQAIKIACAA
jgi:tetratricopeptide (TPR) repeat protein